VRDRTFLAFGISHDMNLLAFGISHDRTFNISVSTFGCPLQCNAMQHDAKIAV